MKGLEDVVVLACSCGYTNTPASEDACAFCGNKLNKIEQSVIKKLLADNGYTISEETVKFEVLATSMYIYIYRGEWININLIMDLFKYFKGKRVYIGNDGYTTIIKIENTD